MAGEVFKTKKEAREHLIRMLRNQDGGERSRKNERIRERVFHLREYRNAESILLYASFGGEADTDRIMEQAFDSGKTVCLPLINISDRSLYPKQIHSLDTDLRAGAYGVREPLRSLRDVPREELDLVIVPGVGFDRHNNRLGRGAGYYDRFLSRLPRETPTIGLAFDFQVIPSIPELTAQDQPVKQVIQNLH